MTAVDWGDFLTDPAGVPDRFEELGLHQAMAGCGQDPVWHAEGDVWTHTRRVIGEALALAEVHDLGTEETAILAAAALFHDSAKPEVSAPDPHTGRIRAPGHARRGAARARVHLREGGCPLAAREAVCALVRWHGAPPHVFEPGGHAALRAARLSWLTDARLLHLLAVADLRGRDSLGGKDAGEKDAGEKDAGRGEDDLELFAELCRESNCYGRRAAFASETHRLACLQRRASPGYAPADRFRGEALLICGPPGSGKDRYLRLREPGLETVSLDALRKELGVDPVRDDQGSVAAAARDRCRALMRTGRPFALNATNVSERLRRRWTGLFRDYDYRLRIVYLEPPVATLLRRNRDRAGGRVPERAILRILSKAEPPTWEECHDLALDDS